MCCSLCYGLKQCYDSSSAVYLSEVIVLLSDASMRGAVGDGKKNNKGKGRKGDRVWK